MKFSMLVVMFLWVSFLLHAQEMDLKALEELKASIQKINTTTLTTAEKEIKIKAFFNKAINDVETAKSNFTRNYQFDKSKRAKGILEQLKAGKIEVEPAPIVKKESSKSKTDKESSEKKEILVKEESLPLTIEESIFPKIKGFWEYKDDKGEAFMQFETDRVHMFNDGQGLMFFRAQYSKERIWCFYNATPFAFGIKVINPDKIEFDNNGTKLIFTKAVRELPKLEIKPFSFGNSIVTEEEKATIQQELKKRLKTDQEVRTKKELANKAQEVDTDNTKYLKEVISKFGWPDASRFGAESANIAFLIVQHSGDLSLMLPSLSCIENDVKAKKIDGQDFALLYDRLNLNIGRKQKYGSQVVSSNEGMIVLPCEDKDKVEQFRRELGIFSLASYLRMFGQNPSTKPNFYEDKIPQ